MAGLFLPSWFGGFIAFVFWALLVGIVFLAYRLPKNRNVKIVLPLCLVASYATWHVTVTNEEKRINAEKQAYSEAAWAHFRKRCAEGAGEKIYKTVENVEGIYLINPRLEATNEDLSNRYWMGDPYGYSLHGSRASQANEYLYPHFVDWSVFPVTDRKVASNGFQFVELPSDEQPPGFKRYTYDWRRERTSVVTSADRKATYGVRWEDISSEADRKYWVAGGKTQIVDLVTNEVIAEQTHFLIEPGFGSTGSAREPWAHARQFRSEIAACPAIPKKDSSSPNRLFVEKALRPLQLNSK